MTPAKTDKQLEKEKRAAHKAQNCKVFISGVQGPQNLETGVAYYYRGHYIYTPPGNPVEPIPYSTRTGIKLASITDETAPVFNYNDLGNVLESSIGHLTKTRTRLWATQLEQEQGMAKQTAQTSSGRKLGTAEMAVPMPSSNAQVPSTGTLPSNPSRPTFTPHDRAMFLADSAPNSRAPSTVPMPGISRPSTPRQMTALRKTASHSHVPSLLAHRKPASPLADISEGTSSQHMLRHGEQRVLTSATEEWMDPSEIDAFVETVSRPRSRGEGRLRRASVALNEAYNANLRQGHEEGRCALHGGQCDGVSVGETWLTQRYREGGGFKDLYPVIEGAGGRVVVDWHRLVEEEKRRRG